MFRIARATELGEFVRHRRRSLHWTQNELARRATTGRQWVIELERGKKDAAPLDMVLRVLGVLELSMFVGDAGPVDLRSRAAVRRRPRRNDGHEHAFQHGSGARAGETNGRLPRSQDREVSHVARGPETGRAQHYRPTNLESFSPQGERFYYQEYLPLLREMVAKVVETEGPIYQDVLVRRLAKAHGFARAGGGIREIVEKTINSAFARTKEGTRTIVWPIHLVPQVSVDFRSAPPGTRDHADVPLPELTGLAGAYLADGVPAGNVVQRMREEFGLARITGSTQQRFFHAVRLAQSRIGGST
jgi:transcriptional regulator with XRE-family HTH domain